MNIIKYKNAAGKKVGVRICQPSYATLCNPEAPPRPPTMAEADHEMHRRGFRRAGIRWKRAA